MIYRNILIFGVARSFHMKFLKVIRKTLASMDPEMEIYLLLFFELELLRCPTWYTSGIHHVSNAQHHLAVFKTYFHLYH